MMAHLVYRCLHNAVLRAGPELNDRQLGMIQAGAQIIVLDIRYPSRAAATLSGHHASVNGVCWAPHSSCHLSTAGDDRQALIWDLSLMPKPIEDPILCYEAQAEINSLSWSAAHTELIAIAFDDKVQVLRV